MRDTLAERLLAVVMKWTPEDMARELPDLQALATFKYDEYQQFSPGMRFIESLACWLEQFELDNERKLAYEFIRSRLVFISSAEMAHFVSIAFPDFIRPLLIRKTAVRLGMQEMFVTGIANSMEFKVLLRQSLFLGLSDGARIDLFRRYSPEINHEQVCQTYEIPNEKAEDMVSKLNSDLEVLLSRKPTNAEKKFHMVFLLDDFSGSGLSYLRKESNSLKNAGKIYKVFHNISSNGPLNKLVDSRDLHICIVLYVATTRALSYIKRCTGEWLKENSNESKYDVLAVQEITDMTQLDPDKDNQIINLLKKYFDKSIINNHYRIGQHDKPYLGFDHCALPLVLSSNTPNNSIPLLWFENHRKYRGLFPRVSRHRSEL